MLKRVLTKVFPPSFWAQVMAGLFLVLVFLIPAMFVVAFWPSELDPDWWKIVAVSGCSISAGIMLPTYFYLVARLTEYEAELENGDSSRNAKR